MLRMTTSYVTLSKAKGLADVWELLPRNTSLLLYQNSAEPIADSGVENSSRDSLHRAGKGGRA